MRTRATMPMTMPTMAPVLRPPPSSSMVMGLFTAGSVPVAATVTVLTVPSAVTVWTTDGVGLGVSVVLVLLLVVDVEVD